MPVTMAATNSTSMTTAIDVGIIWSPFIGIVPTTVDRGGSIFLYGINTTYYPQKIFLKKVKSFPTSENIFRKT